jgi:DNA-binding PadR family transcriptional regulator
MAFMFSPSSGTVYPILMRLEAEGRIRGQWGERISEMARSRHYYAVDQGEIAHE